MKNKIRQIVAGEDKKNPLTDEQIAQRLGLRRDEVTLLRHQLNIADSRKRRLPVLQSEVAEVLRHNPHISNRELTSLLQHKGFDVSRFTVLNMRKDMQAHTDVAADGPLRTERDDHGRIRALPTFSAMIGAEGTLKAAIQQAQAAVLYPPHGLHTLLFGQTGVGKSKMAEAMYDFARERQIMAEDAPFVVFNCADYAKNPQLLLAQLFGYVKGAFTGADRDKEGLVDRANGGILFLDEIHRLPPEGQENLFYLIDKNMYRRLGEVDFQRKAELLIVGATTESPDSSLLLTLRRRIPMLIELPPLLEWTMSERLELVFHFVNEETKRIGKNLLVDREVIAALIAYECPGNTGQLHSDIRVLLARALLKNMSASDQEQVLVQRQDLPANVTGGCALNFTQQGGQLLKKEQFAFIPGQRADPLEPAEQETASADLYEWIAERHQHLKEQGQNEELIQLIISQELESRLDSAALEKNERHEVRLQQLVRLVGDKIVQTVEQMLWIAEKHLLFDYQKISYVLAIHLKGILDRQQSGTLSAVDEASEYQTDTIEYSVALEMSKVVQRIWDIALPAAEIGFLAMYLSRCRTYVEPKKAIGVVVASYGQIAKSMVDVAQRLFEKSHAIPVELHWNDELPDTVRRVGASLQQADQGAGVILLTDMGTTFLREISWQQQFGVHVRVVAPLTTALVVEVLRKCLYSDTSIDQLVLTSGGTSEAIQQGKAAGRLPKAVVAVCVTGEGAARRLAALVQESLAEKGKNLTYLIGSSLSIRKKYQEWAEHYDILAVIGTLDPLLAGIPFISFKEIVDESGLAFLQRLLLVQEGMDTASVQMGPLHLQELLSPELAVDPLTAATKTEVMEQLADRLIAAGYVTPEFRQKVWERERAGPTHINGVAAIPHADTVCTIRPAIAAARLSQPVEWERGVWIRFVFMLAIDERCQPAIEELYELMTNPDFVAYAEEQTLYQATQLVVKIT